MGSLERDQEGLLIHWLREGRRARKQKREREKAEEKEGGGACVVARQAQPLNCCLSLVSSLVVSHGECS